MLHRWWREGIGICVGALLGVVGLQVVEAQTLGAGVKVPIELTNFTAANVTDNGEIFGQLRVGSFALEMGVFFPWVPLVVSAHAKWILPALLGEAGGTLFIGAGGFRIFIGDVTFTGFVVKGGMEWPLSDLPVRAIVEGGWQSSVEIPLAGAGGFFLTLGVRWDL